MRQIGSAVTSLWLGIATFTMHVKHKHCDDITRKTQKAALLIETSVKHMNFDAITRKTQNAIKLMQTHV